MAYSDCIRRLAQAAGRALSDDEVEAIYSRIHKAARDIKAERLQGGEKLGGKVAQKIGADADLTEDLITAAARRAAEDLQAQAA